VLTSTADNLDAAAPWVPAVSERARHLRDAARLLGYIQEEPQQLGLQLAAGGEHA
jgi:hypothetical protein